MLYLALQMGDYGKLDENRLVALLQKDNDNAFAEIYRRYRVKMISAALRLLKDPVLVEELVQDLFLKVWELRRNIDPEQSLNAYLYKIAHNLAYDTFRKAARDKKLFAQLLLSSSPAHNAVETYIYSKENRLALQQAISLLPPQQQKAITLCKLEERTHEEAARILNISPGTVNNHLHRAHIFLREHFSSKEVATSVAVAFVSAFLGELL